MEISRFLGYFLVATLVGAPFGLLLILLVDLVKASRRNEERLAAFGRELDAQVESVEGLRRRLEELSEDQGFGSTMAEGYVQEEVARGVDVPATTAPAKGDGRVHSQGSSAPQNASAAPAGHPSGRRDAAERDDFLESLSLNEANIKQEGQWSPLDSGSDRLIPIEDIETLHFTKDQLADERDEPEMLDPEIQEVNTMELPPPETFEQTCAGCGAQFPDALDNCPSCGRPA